MDKIRAYFNKPSPHVNAQPQPPATGDAKARQPEPGGTTAPRGTVPIAWGASSRTVVVGSGPSAGAATGSPQDLDHKHRSPASPTGPVLRARPATVPAGGAGDIAAEAAAAHDKQQAVWLLKQLSALGEHDPMQRATAVRKLALQPLWPGPALSVLTMAHLLPAAGLPRGEFARIVPLLTCLLALVLDRSTDPVNELASFVASCSTPQHALLLGACTAIEPRHREWGALWLSLRSALVERNPPDADTKASKPPGAGAEVAADPLQSFATGAAMTGPERPGWLSRRTVLATAANTDFDRLQLLMDLIRVQPVTGKKDHDVSMLAQAPCADITGALVLPTPLSLGGITDPQTIGLARAQAALNLVEPSNDTFLPAAQSLFAQAVASFPAQLARDLRVLGSVVAGPAGERPGRPGPAGMATAGSHTARKVSQEILRRWNASWTCGEASLLLQARTDAPGVGGLRRHLGLMPQYIQGLAGLIDVLHRAMYQPEPLGSGATATERYRSTPAALLDQVDNWLDQLQGALHALSGTGDRRVTELMGRVSDLVNWRAQFESTLSPSPSPAKAKEAPSALAPVPALEEAEASEGYETPAQSEDEDDDSPSIAPSASSFASSAQPTAAPAALASPASPPGSE